MWVVNHTSPHFVLLLSTGKRWSSSGIKFWLLVLRIKTFHDVNGKKLKCSKWESWMCGSEKQFLLFVTEYCVLQVLHVPLWMFQWFYSCSIDGLWDILELIISLWLMLHDPTLLILQMLSCCLWLWFLLGDSNLPAVCCLFFFVLGSSPTD